MPDPMPDPVRGDELPRRIDFDARTRAGLQVRTEQRDGRYSDYTTINAKQHFDIVEVNGKRWRISAEPIPDDSCRRCTESRTECNSRKAGDACCRHCDHSSPTTQPVDSRTFGEIGAELEREAIGRIPDHDYSDNCGCWQCKAERSRRIVI